MRTLIVEQRVPGIVDQLVVVDHAGGIWLTCAAPWWHCRAWLAFWLLRGDRARARFEHTPKGHPVPYVYALCVRIGERHRDAATLQ